MIDFARLNRDLAVKKIVVMVPRLASEHDGEVVATVRAIQRTLEGASMDWHDLVKRISESEVEPAPPRPPSPTYDRHQGRDKDAHKVDALLDDTATLGTLSEWEQTFMYSLRAQLQGGRWLTDKQRETLERVCNKAARAAPPRQAQWPDGADE